MAKKLPAYLSKAGILHHTADSALAEDMQHHWLRATNSHYGPELSTAERISIFDFLVSNREVVKSFMGDFELKLNLLIKGGDSKC